MLPQDMKKCQVYAGRKISFEPEEVTQMKSFESSGLKLHVIHLYLSIVIHFFIVGILQSVTVLIFCSVLALYKSLKLLTCLLTD